MRKNLLSSGHVFICLSHFFFFFSVKNSALWTEPSYPTSFLKFFEESLQQGRLNQPRNTKGINHKKTFLAFIEEKNNESLVWQQCKRGWDCLLQLCLKSFFFCTSYPLASSIRGIISALDAFSRWSCCNVPLPVFQRNYWWRRKRCGVDQRWIEPEVKEHPTAGLSKKIPSWSKVAKNLEIFCRHFVDRGILIFRL